MEKNKNKKKKRGKGRNKVKAIATKEPVSVLRGRWAETKANCQIQLFFGSKRGV